MICSAYAHYPHDTHEFFELAPEYSTDHKAFIASKQVSSTRPVSVLVSNDKGNTWGFNAEGVDNIGQLTSVTVFPLFSKEKKPSIVCQVGY